MPQNRPKTWVAVASRHLLWAHANPGWRSPHHGRALARRADVEQPMTILRRRGAPRQQDAIFRQCSVKGWISHDAPRRYGVPPSAQISMPQVAGQICSKLNANRPRTHLASMRRRSVMRSPRSTGSGVSAKAAISVSASAAWKWNYRRRPRPGCRS
jgi:hypothetical protein